MKKKKIAALTGIASVMLASWFTVTTTSVTAAPASAQPPVHLTATTTTKSTTPTHTPGPIEQFFERLRADLSKLDHHKYK